MPDAHLIRVPEAAKATGLPVSTLRKSFMKVRPANVPPPPPHRRIGRSVYILADELRAWVEALPQPKGAVRRGRPTVAERIARRGDRPAPG